VDLAEESGQHVRFLQVEVVVGTVEVGGHDREEGAGNKGGKKRLKPLIFHMD